MNDISPIRAKSGTNQEGTSAHNRRVMIEALRLNGALSRADLARATQLTKQAVSNIIEDLERDGLVVALDAVRKGRGQPSTPSQAGSGRRLRHRAADRPACDAGGRRRSGRQRAGAGRGQPAVRLALTRRQNHSRSHRRRQTRAG